MGTAASDVPRKAPPEQRQLTKRSTAVDQLVQRGPRQRDPKQRLRDIGDARRVLDQSSPAYRIRRPSSRRRHRSRDPGVLERCHGAWRPLRWRVPRRSHSFTSARRPRHSNVSDSRVPAPGKSSIGGFALSPDGRYLAFATFGGSVSGVSVDATTKLWLRPIDSLDGRAVAGTEGTLPQQDQVFWSPDSEFIGFVTRDGKLKKVSVNGGPPQTLISGVSPTTRAAWGRDGTILFVRVLGAPIQRVPDVGGPVVDVRKKIGGESRFLPQFLPDGRHFLFSVDGVSTEANGIYVASLEDDAPPQEAFAR